MVLVEVEVSEEEEEANDEHNRSGDTTVSDTDQTNINEDMPITNKDESNSEINTEDANQIENSDSNSGITNDFQTDMNLDQDSMSVQLSSKNESELPFSEQNSNQDSNEPGNESNVENQDSLLQTENSMDVVENKNDKEFDVAVLNTDSQTQCKPDEEGNGNGKNEVSFSSILSDRKDNDNSEAMETDLADERKVHDEIVGKDSVEKMDEDRIDGTGDVKADRDTKRDPKVSFFFCFF